MKKMVEWVEIPTVDFKRGVNFYNKVFNLSMEEVDCGVEKIACFPTGEGAIFYREGYIPSENGIVVNFNVSDTIEDKNIAIKQTKGKKEKYCSDNIRKCQYPQTITGKNLICFG